MKHRIVQGVFDYNVSQGIAAVFCRHPDIIGKFQITFLCLVDAAQNSLDQRCLGFRRKGCRCRIPIIGFGENRGSVLNVILRLAAGIALLQQNTISKGLFLTGRHITDRPGHGFVLVVYNDRLGISLQPNIPIDPILPRSKGIGNRHLGAAVRSGGDCQGVFQVVPSILSPNNFLCHCLFDLHFAVLGDQIPVEVDFDGNIADLNCCIAVIRDL